MLRVLGPIKCNGENSGRATHLILVKNHREAVAEEDRRDVVYINGEVSVGISRDAVNYNLHWLQTGDCGPGGGAVPNI